jgi:hypothetical protein
LIIASGSKGFSLEQIVFCGFYFTLIVFFLLKFLVFNLFGLNSYFSTLLVGFTGFSSTFGFIGGWRPTFFENS